MDHKKVTYKTSNCYWKSATNHVPVKTLILKLHHILRLLFKIYNMWHGNDTTI